MSILVRKIDKAKWLQNDIISGEEVSADAITICTRTSKNTLSTWLISDVTQINNAVLAIVTGQHHLDTIDVVCLHQEELQDNGLALEETKGTTPIEHLSDSHRDIVNITYSSLGIIAQNIISAFKDGKVIRYTQGMLKKLLRDAISSGELTKNLLSPDIAKKL